MDKFYALEKIKYLAEKRRGARELIIWLKAFQFIFAEKLAFQWDSPLLSNAIIPF